MRGAILICLLALGGCAASVRDYESARAAFEVRDDRHLGSSTIAYWRAGLRGPNLLYYKGSNSLSVSKTFPDYGPLEYCTLAGRRELKAKRGSTDFERGSVRHSVYIENIREVFSELLAEGRDFDCKCWGGKNSTEFVIPREAMRGFLDGPR